MTTPFDPSELQTLKRPQLQKLCKSIGIKANSKTSQLVSELQKYAATNFSEAIKNPSAAEQTPRRRSNSSRKSSEIQKLKVVSDEKAEPNNVKEMEKTSTKKETPMITEYKEKVLQRLENKVKESMPSNIFECKIPRFVASGVTIPGVKSTTPPSNKWTKIHQKNFEKMDSIDVYLAKKRKRTETMYESVRKAKEIAVDAKSTIEAVVTTPVQQFRSKTAKFSVDTRKTPDPVKPKVQTSTKEPLKSKLKTPTKSTSKIAAPRVHVKIFESRRKSENCGRIITKPKSPVVRKSVAFIPHKGALGNVQKTPHAGVRKSIVVTPFRQINQEQVTPTPKKRFDLQASLAKPLTYKPHTGKLKTPPFLKKNVDKRPIRAIQATDHKDIKTVKVASRENRRSAYTKARTARRAKTVDAQRGLK